ncbi:hypothetical protein BJY52DRAFT_1221931 [Lactarius psammicola]|nr:hypothetical protein BJY52DRAFT_1221931 [Lactarius psammicola]
MDLSESTFDDAMEYDPFELASWIAKCRGSVLQLGDSRQVGSDSRVGSPKVTGAVSDQFNSLLESPNVEEEAFAWGLEGKLVDHSLIIAMVRSYYSTFPMGDSPSPPLVLVTASPPQSPTTEKSGEVMTEPVPPSKDPTCPITGMYRLLDLIMEQGNSGLVDKIVVAQKSLQAFINALSPGAYSSITKVNFKILDNLLLKPIGVYGSKEEIVRFLREMSAVDVEMARELLVPQRDYAAKGAGPILRSGLYIIRTFTSTEGEQTYVLYWPEDTTWDDNAVSTVQRSRVTFMRYLTKLCDQLVCLLSAEHSQAIVWGDGVDDPDDASLDAENDASHRLFNFRVEKKSEQEENVIVRKGFTRFPDWSLFELHTSEDDVVLCLSETLDDKALEILMGLGLSTRFTKEYEAWERRKIEIEKRFQSTITQRQADVHVTLQQNFGDIQAKVREAVIDEILKAFRMLRRDGFSPKSTSAAPVNSVDSGGVAGPLQDVFIIYPKAASTFQSSILAANLNKGIRGNDFQYRKARMLILLYLLKNYPDLNVQQTRSLCDAILVNYDRKKALKLLKSFAKGEKGNWLTDTVADTVAVFWKGKEAVVSKEEAMWKDANNYATSISDANFLSYVRTIPDANHLHDAAVECERAAYDCLTTQLDSLVSVISHQILSIQIEECNKQVQREVKNEEEKDSRSPGSNVSASYIDNFATKKEHHFSQDSYSISGRKETLQDQEIEYSIHILRLLADQRHNLQLDPSYVPIPVLNEQLPQSFHIPSETIVKYAHLLEGDRILLGLVDPQGNVMILLDRLIHIDSAIQSRSYAKFLHQDKIGETCLFAFDESKRMLAVYASTRMQLHIFVFDEELKSLRGLGTPIDLLPFYNPGVSITHACFVHGSEEILFIDSSAQARIFSLITLQPKPASLQLPQMPRAIYSSPDGSCVIVVQDEDGERTITAYHWSTFASTRGISVALPVPDFPVDLDAALLTSIVNRNNIHLIGLDLDSRSCRSVVLDITQRATEFAFQERRSTTSSRHGKQTIHNSLINCHSDVWTRFPVVPAVKRHTITSSSQRQQKTLMFVTDDHRRPFSTHFSDIIWAFEKTSRKPTGDELKSIVVSARPFASFTQEFLSSSDWPVSRFRAGEWLADLLCLIPIHIAITHENRFVPLKDGVVSPQLEKSLLGAEVNRIVDSLSFGWYESIFQSYWASKPVKVVSSMGEQSVGKSFALNHLVDTSFAGSAMRTTEGVWMSVSPTEDALIVALDFEGVHSLERSAQEDTLLVLFNTAISNLVLFRNNFALSRDITGLFQSFQSSSSVFDPASNPSLFQSTLVVIIKDVIDTDSDEVMREFALKFQKIVQDEQDANFITRLHGGKLQIIPWPVIGSREFYKLFSAVKKKLDQQKTSHRTAGEFLHMLKTLMAKLKANDWGAMSQTMAAHRASSLLAILPVALETGYSEVVPELEPLKGFDTDLVIEAEDTEARFLLAGPDTPAADRERHLLILCDSWDQSDSRQYVDDSEWISDLVQYLTHLVDLRVAHVDMWLKSNIQRFQTEHSSIEELRRTFNSAVIDLRAGVQLCKSPCAECNLFCIQSRFHEGGHNCLTSHECIHRCTFCDKEMVNRLCGQRSQGRTCTIICADSFADSPEGKAATTSDHRCSAPLHMCGQPCDLIDLNLPNGESYTCSGICRVPIGDHLHGLSRSENHLCGMLFTWAPSQEHTCSALCSAAGICQIDTIPQSIEATFAGRHETFQYTKRRLVYSSASNAPKLLSLGKSNTMALTFIVSTKYSRSTIAKPANSDSGHTQQEHDTQHGSMSRTRWAVDGPEGNCIELGGHTCISTTVVAIRTIIPKSCILTREWSQTLTKRKIGSHTAFTGVGWVMETTNRWEVSKLSILYRSPILANIKRTLRSVLNLNYQGPEHTVEVGGVNAQPSRCTLPMFHPHMDACQRACWSWIRVERRNPIVMQQAFHVIFVIDRAERGRDAYSLIFFSHEPSTSSIEYDFTSSPDELLTAALHYEADGGTDFSSALKRTQDVMTSHWSTERTPIVIFLSDGESYVRDEAIYDVCRGAVSQGKPLSFHTVSFGEESSSSSLRRMAEIALEVQKNAPSDPLLPAAANIPSAYTEALDTVRLAETFLGIAESLRKPRGFLFPSPSH